MFRERLRGLKRELGIREGLLERLTPIAGRRVKLREVLRIRIISGISYGEEAGVWYRVDFGTRLRDAEVVAVGEARETRIITRLIDKVPDVDIPTVKRPPNVGLKEIERVEITREEIEAEIKEALGDWGIWNWVRDAIAWASSFGAHFAYRVISGVATDKIRDTINVAIRDFNTRINRQTDYIYSDLNVTIRATNEKVNRQIDIITDRVNRVLYDLYSMWGLPTDLSMVPVHIRNVTETGFEFLSLGKTTIHWIAVGES